MIEVYYSSFKFMFKFGHNVSTSTWRRDKNYNNYCKEWIVIDIEGV